MSAAELQQISVEEGGKSCNWSPQTPAYIWLQSELSVT